MKRDLRTKDLASPDGHGSFACETVFNKDSVRMLHPDTVLLEAIVYYRYSILHLAGGPKVSC